MATDPTNFPVGPTLAYCTSADADGSREIRLIDRTPLDDPRERAICRALLQHALHLIEESELTSALGVVRMQQ